MDDMTRTMPPAPNPGWPEHRYIYSTEDGDSCACGFVPSGGHFRFGDDEFMRHCREAVGDG